ncbi:MAG: sensor histidine kinase [Pseudohongiellaceae bacterium]
MDNSNTNADAYKKAYLRQRQARERAEELLEFRSRELYDSNQSLIDANRQLAEQQAQLVAQEKLAAKSEFLSMMSHEIKTPLNAIISMAFILKEMEMEADAVEALEILSRSSEHLRTLIMNLLDFSKFEAKGEELNERDCSLFKLLGDVREMCKTNLKEGVAYEHDIADDVPDRIKLDDIKLKQVLINLVGNAVKFTSSGYVKKQTSVESKDGKHYLIFRIYDTGIGIPEEKLAALFDPFSQVDEGNTRNFGGTGLGLHIALNYARLMGGDITVTSELGTGTEFRFHCGYVPT